MRQLRKLGQNVWYEVRTGINNREPLFRRTKALTIFARVFQETMLRFRFTIRGLRIEEDRLVFYIKPENGFELPKIMKWMKQVFAQRYNVAAGRTGHIWGDRYWSQILEGEPPEVEEESATGDSPCWRGATTGVRPHKRGTATGVRPHKRGATTGVRPHKRGTATGVRPCWRERERSPCFSPSPPSPHPHNRA